MEAIWQEMSKSTLVVLLCALAMPRCTLLLVITRTRSNTRHCPFTRRLKGATCQYPTVGTAVVSIWTVAMVHRLSGAQQFEARLRSSDNQLRLQAVKELRNTVIGNKFKKQQYSHLVPALLELAASSSDAELVVQAVSGKPLASLAL